MLTTSEAKEMPLWCSALSGQNSKAKRRCEKPVLPIQVLADEGQLTNASQQRALGFETRKRTKGRLIDTGVLKQHVLSQVGSIEEKPAIEKNNPK